jgi:cell division protease FtsH
MAKNVILWVIIAIVLISVFNGFTQNANRSGKLDYSDFVSQVKQGQIRDVSIQGRVIKGQTANGQNFETYNPETENTPLITTLFDHNVRIKGEPPDTQPLLVTLLIHWFPLLLIIGLYLFFMRQMQGGGGKGGALSFGKSKHKMFGEDQVKITFSDVAGVEEAKAEVFELVEFLRDPSKFQKLGGSIPRGVLMVGSPGTGKTLLAKAIAGEAKVPFFSISGSDFVEMFVGVGASRVRDMFDQAKKHSPCIIFIDEIDAVGRHRGAGLGGGHDEREQTLNQLLVEMDGFEGGEGVIVIAATNRPHVLDPALLFAARADKKNVDMEDFEKAKDKIMMGAERRSMVMSEAEKKLTAYHEAGHAIVGRLVPDHDPVYKVTIIPRGRALGVTMFLPEEDRYSHSKKRLISSICSLFGGRIAEEIIFGRDQVTTGASNDIERATDIARNMVTKWGLSDKMGPLAYGEDDGEVFLGHSVTQHKNMSDRTAQEIDSEIRSVIDNSYAKAEQLLRDNEDKLHIMAEALLKYETIDSDQINAIMEGREPGPPKDWSDSTTPPDASSGGDTESVSKKDDSAKPIGGPAGQH